MNIRQIARHLGMSHVTVRKYVQAERFPERARRKPGPSMLDPYLAYLERRWDEGCENALQLWREIKQQGYPGTNRQASQWMQLRRRVPAPNHPKRGRTEASEPRSQALPSSGFGSASLPMAELELPSAKQLSWLMLRRPEQLSETETCMLGHIRQDAEIESCYARARTFVAMVRTPDSTRLDAWLEDCASCGSQILVDFSRGVRQDYAAVRAALELPWSNGQAEGHINKLKLVKRQMYGRAKFDLLRQRILHAA